MRAEIQESLFKFVAIINLDRDRLVAVALGPTTGPCDASCLNTCILTRNKVFRT